MPSCLCGQPWRNSAGCRGRRRNRDQPRPCQQLLTLRDETQKHGAALQAARQKKAKPDEICPLFQAFLAAEAKMIAGLEENSATCAVPAELISQVKSAHDKATQMWESRTAIRARALGASTPSCPASPAA